MWLDGHRIDDVVRRRPAAGDDLRSTDAQLGEHRPQWSVVDVERDDQRVAAVTSLVYVVAIIQPQRRRRRGVQPRVAATQPDQVLVQRPYFDTTSI